MSSENKESNTMGRRDMLTTIGAAAAGMAAAAVSPAAAAEPQPGADQPKNPYGGGPSKGLQFPPYYQPTPSVRSRMNYFPGSETLGPNEMRISFVGSCPYPLRRDQAGTS